MLELLHSDYIGVNMKNKYLSFCIISLFLILAFNNVSAMIRFHGNDMMDSNYELSDYGVSLTYETTSFYFYAFDNITRQTLLVYKPQLVAFYDGVHEMSIYNGYFYISHEGNIFGGDGEWRTPISANTSYYIACEYNLNSAESYNPTCYFNGGEVTMTEVSSPSGLLTYQGGGIRIGSSNNINPSIGSNYFNGYMSELAIWNTTLSDENMFKLTWGRVKGMALDINSSNLILYAPMDEAEDEGYFSNQVTNLFPDSDVTTDWSYPASPTSHVAQLVDGNINTFIRANFSDVNQSDVFGVDDVMFNSNYDYVGVKVEFAGNGTSGTVLAQWLMRVKKGASWLSYVTTPYMGIGTRTYTAMSFFSSSPWTQSEGDALQIEVNASNMDTGGRWHINEMNVTWYLENATIKDYIYGNNFHNVVLPGTQGYGEIYLSYPQEVGVW